MNPPAKAWPALACAALAVVLAFAWQWLEVRYNYGGNWTGLLCVGDRWPTPPSVDGRNLYRVNGPGYDAQFYYYIAYDPLMRGDVKQYVDNPPMRYRRILVPALARLLALGRPDRIFPAYLLVVLGCVFAGSWWLARFFQRAGYSALWGLAFLAVPSVAVSIERLNVDIALAALCVGYALWWPPNCGLRIADCGFQARSLQLYALLVLAAMARETGLALAGAAALYELMRRRYTRALLAACCTLPWLGWAIFARSRLWADRTEWVSIPFAGLVARTLRPVQFAITGRWLALASALDYLALLGIWLALVLTAYFVWKRRFGPIETGCIVFGAAVALLSQPDIWADAYAFGRSMSPLLVWLALTAIRPEATESDTSPHGTRALRFAALAPLALNVPRIALQIATVSLPIIRGVLHDLRTI